MATKKAKPTKAAISYPITLNYAGGRVVVFAEDGDRFVMTARRAAKACQQAEELDAAARDQAERANDAIHRFENDLILPLRNWCETNTERVTACYVPVPVGHLEVYIVGRSEKYDFDLGSELAKFELKLVDDGWLVHTMLVPQPEDEHGMRAHFDYDGTLQVYADRQSAPGQG